MLFTQQAETADEVLEQWLTHTAIIRNLLEINTLPTVVCFIMLRRAASRKSVRIPQQSMKTNLVCAIALGLLVGAASAQSIQITSHPQRRDVSVGADTVFRIVATGDAPLTYRWFKGEAELDGELAAELILESVQFEDGGSYSVEVTAGEVSVTSNPAQLHVRSPLNNRALALDGAGDFVTIPSDPRLQNAAALTVEFWVFARSSTVNQYGSFINKGDGIGATSARTMEFRWLPTGTMSVNLFLDHIPGQPDAAGMTLPVPVREWTHVAVTFDSGGGEVAGYVNGQLEFTTTTLNGSPIQGRLIRQTSLPLVFGVTPGFADSHATGRMEEVRIWNQARSGTEIATDYTCKLTGLEAGLMGYWAFDDGGVDDFTTYQQHGVLAGDAHTELISEGDLPVGACGQPVFVGAEAHDGTFKTSVRSGLGQTVRVDATTDWQTWVPAGIVPDALGRQEVKDTILPGLKVFRAQAQ